MKPGLSDSVPAHIKWSESEVFIKHTDIMVRRNMGHSVMADILEKVKFILKTYFEKDFYEHLKNMHYF